MEPKIVYAFLFKILYTEAKETIQKNHLNLKKAGLRLNMWNLSQFQLFFGRSELKLSQK